MQEIDIKKKKLLERVPTLKGKYEKMTSQEIRDLYKRNMKLFFIIDIFCSVADVVVITWSYMTHFSYNSNGFKNSDSTNIQRAICCFISLCVIICLVYRYIKRLETSNLKFLLSLNRIIHKNKKMIDK